MSQQAAAGRGAGHGGGRKQRFIPRGGGDHFDKPFRSSTAGIKKWTFNTGQNKYAALFTLHREEVANYIQRTLPGEGYLVAQTIRSGMKQSIVLPPPVDQNDPDKEDLEAIRAKDVKTIAKRRQKLKESLLKGYAMVYAQCSQGVRDKLKASKDWSTIEQEQSLHDLVTQVEKISVGFNDHKQDVFNLVQALKTLFLYAQGEKESVEEEPVGQGGSLWRITGRRQGADGCAPDTDNQRGGEPNSDAAEKSGRRFFGGGQGRPPHQRSGSTQVRSPEGCPGKQLPHGQ